MAPIARPHSAAGTALVCLATLVATLLVIDFARSPADAPECAAAAAAGGTKGSSSDQAPARPLTWAEGRRIHLGTRTFTADAAPVSLDLVDGGAAFTTLDGGIWFTDGATAELIGLTSGGQRRPNGLRWGHAGKPNGWVVSDNAGSRLAWFEHPSHDRPEIVVYDAAARRRVARLPVDVRPSCPRCARVLSVDATHVYWTLNLWHGYDQESPEGARRTVLRQDLSTGQRHRLPAQCLERSLRTRPRMLVVEGSSGAGRLTDGIGQEFTPAGRRLVATAFEDATVLDTGSGRPLRVRAPRGFGFGSAERLILFQWLDDDRFALLDATSWNAGVRRGEDLVVCTLSAHSCVVAVRRSRAAGSPLLPEIGTPGSEIATRR